MANMSVPEYQAMLKSGGPIISGAVDLYPPISADQLPLVDGARYTLRDGGTVTIEGPAKNWDGTDSAQYVWGRNGVHYERATGHEKGCKGPSFSSIAYLTAPTG